MIHKRKRLMHTLDMTLFTALWYNSSGNSPYADKLRTGLLNAYRHNITSKIMQRVIRHSLLRHEQ